LHKLMLYAHGQQTIELDDVMAVVADASALALDALVDAAFAGRIADVEKEYSKAMVAGTPPFAIVGAALRQVERLHSLRLEVESGSSASAVIERVQPPVHFRRKTLVEAALRHWTADRLAKAMAMLAEASFDARRYGDLAETIAQRAMTVVARSAAARRD
jgi:DNA polymerase-3 subunit delta